MRLEALELALELPPRGLVLGDAVPATDLDCDGAAREGAVLGGVPQRLHEHGALLVAPAEALKVEVPVTLPGGDAVKPLRQQQTLAAKTWAPFWRACPPAGCLAPRAATLSGRGHAAALRGSSCSLRCPPRSWASQASGAAPCTHSKHHHHLLPWQQRRRQPPPPPPLLRSRGRCRLSCSSSRAPAPRG